MKIGKYTIMGWVQNTRSIYVDNYLYSSIEVGPRSYVYNFTNRCVIIDQWILRFDFYEIGSYDIYDNFCSIHGDGFNTDLFFKTAEEGKEFVDLTLKKIIKLKAFL